MDSDIPVVTFNYDELTPISQALEGLELHSESNCLLCVSLSSVSGMSDQPGLGTSLNIGDLVSEVRIELSKSHHSEKCKASLIKGTEIQFHLPCTALGCNTSYTESNLYSVVRDNPVV